jgi:predicted acyl esterase
MFGKMISNMMIKPGSSPVFDKPEDFGLKYEEVEFQTRDKVTLRGWLIPGSSERVVIQTHFGVQCSRAGYTPDGKGMIKLWKKDISFLRQARFLNEQGYTVLMYDMRNHGESDEGSCSWISWGPNEAEDVIAAVDYITHHPIYQNAGIGLLSICMGSVASTYAYGLGEKGLQSYPNLKAMVAVQPLHYKQFVAAFGIPKFLGRAGDKLSEERLGFDLNTRTFMPDVSSITIPTMVVQNKNDPWTSLELVESFYDSLQVEKEMLWLELSKDRAAAYDYLGTSPEFLDDFFQKYL